MFPKPSIPDTLVNTNLQKAFMEHVHALEARVFHQVALQLCDMTGNWLFVCPGTIPEAPGGNHHEDTGGLAHHLLAVEETACRLALRYSSKDIDCDLLRFAALFHDIGKCFEFSPQGETVYASLGHVAIALMLIPKLLEAEGAADAVILKVSHCLVSHHGELSQGALVEPMTKEAYILASADRLDADLWRHEHLHGMQNVLHGHGCTKIIL